MLRVHIRDRGLALDLACLFVKFWCKVVDTTATGIIALQCVAIRQPGQFHDGNTSATFSREPIFLILHRHHLVAEAALEEVEIQAVHGDKLGQKHGFKLRLTGQTVSKHEAAFLTGMSVQVNVDM